MLFSNKSAVPATGERLAAARRRPAGGNYKEVHIKQVAPNGINNYDNNNNNNDNNDDNNVDINNNRQW